MTQKQKTEMILKALYPYRYNGKYYSIKELTKKGLNLNDLELQQLGSKLKNDGFIDFIGGPGGPRAELKPNGIEYIEPIIEKEKEHQIVIDQARESYDIILETGNFNLDVHSFKNELESELYEFDLEEDRLIYLKELKRILNVGLELHTSKCEKSDCQAEKYYGKAIFIVSKKIKSLESRSDYTINYTPNDPVSPSGESEIVEKLDEILARLNKAELGQQITYDDLEEKIEDIKTLIPLIGKENIDDLIKGKLMDLALSGIINISVLQEVFKILTGRTIPLLN